MSIIIKILLSLIFLYCSCTLLLYIFQRSILYVPDTSKPNILTADIKGMHEVTIETSDGLSLTSWYIPAKTNKKTIIYFHGNAGNIGDRTARLKPFADAGIGLLLVSYRGYGGNEGSPTENKLYTDGRAAFKFIEDKNVSLKNVIIYGESLGTGIATQMALEYKTPFLILQSPYTAMDIIGATKYPIFPVKYLIKDRYRSIDKIPHITQSLVIIHGQMDDIVPSSMGEELYNAANGNKEIFLTENANHADILDVEMANKIIKFIEKH